MNRWFWGLFLWFISGTAFAGEIEKSINLSLNVDEPCASIAIGITFVAKHTKKGDRNGILNERPYGKFGECFFDKGRHFYRVTGALENSQWCTALSDGFGYRFYTPMLWRLQGEAGYEMTITYYRTGCAGGRYEALLQGRPRKDILAPLPMGYVGVSMELPSLAQILPREHVPDGPSWMNTSMGRLTFGVRAVGYPFTKRKAGEDILLGSLMWRKDF